ncbi:MAG: hypothetical protein ACLTBR_03090 [Anaerostipes sp.]|uniref:hypothetical protein n=1 Tax=Anaerostipes sp. TaxID=1872530 RepID=UPI0039959889
MKYRSKKSFVVDSYDGDGFLLEECGKVVEEGDVYELDTSGSTIIGGELHLDAKDGSWLEIDRKTLEECFEEI